MKSLRLPAIGLALIVVVAACTPAAVSSPSPAPASTPAMTDQPMSQAPTTTPGASATPMIDGAAAAIHVLDFRLDPAALSVTGSTLSLAVTNDGPTVHNVKIRDAAGAVLFGTADLREGQSETVVHEIAPGSYVLFCSLPGHESLGIKGTLTVTAR